MTSRLIAGAALAIVVLAGSAPADGLLQSGPPVGAQNNRNGFFPQYVAGPSAGDRLCPV
jgi:hypothetical protein